MEGIQELLGRKLIKAVAAPLRPLPEETPSPSDLPLADARLPRGERAQPPAVPEHGPSMEDLPLTPEIAKPLEPFFVEEPQGVSEIPPVSIEGGGAALKKIFAIAAPPLLVAVVIAGAMLYIKKPQTETLREPPASPPVPVSTPASPPETVSSVPEPPPSVTPPETPREKAAPPRREKPIDRMRRALSSNPDSVDALLDLGMALVDRQNNVEGILHIKKALSLAPGSARAHFAMGKAYKRLGEKQKAVAEFKEALRLEPSGPQSDQSMAQILELKR